MAVEDGDDDASFISVGKGTTDRGRRRFVAALSGEDIVGLPLEWTLEDCRYHVAERLAEKNLHLVHLTDGQGCRLLEEEHFRASEACLVLRAATYKLRCRECSCVMECSCRGRGPHALTDCGCAERAVQHSRNPICEVCVDRDLAEMAAADAAMDSEAEAAEAAKAAKAFRLRFAWPHRAACLACGSSYRCFCE